MRSLLFIFLMQIIASPYLISQNGKAQINGLVLGLENEPIAYATVALMNEDSSLAVGAISNENGGFRIDKVPAGNFYIQVQNIEYQEYQSELFSVNQGEQKTLPAFKLTKSSVEIDEILVTGKKALIEVHADRMVFNVASSVNASGSNGLELLGKAPGVIIDLDNNIILQGKSGVRIFINGRPSRMSGTDLATMLQSMQADNIESIELITNPSSRYEAEGNAGIINIKLKKNVSEGFNGTIISNYTLGNLSRMDNALSLNYGGSKLKAFANVTRFDNAFQDDLIDVKKQSGYLLDQASYEVYKRNGFNITSGLEYIINPKHALSLVASGVLTDGRSTISSSTDISALISSQFAEILESKTLSNFKSNNINSSLNYFWNISENSTLSADLSAGKFVNDQSIDQPNSYFTPNKMFLRAANNLFEPFTNIDILATNVDFEKKYDKISISTGVKYSYISTNNDFVVNQVENGQVIKNQDKSNNFTYNEKVAAAYFIANASLTTKLKLSAGLRVENTNSEGSLSSTQSANNNSVTRSYTNLFPNVSLSFSDDKNSEFSIGIGRRIGRPNYQDLNPFETKLSELVLWKGNPFLSPNYITNYQISYVFKKKLVISNTYSITRDYFATLLEVVDEKGTFLIPRNMRKATNNGLAISYPQEIRKGWDVTTFFNHNWSRYEGEFESAEIDITANFFNARIQNNLSLPGGITMDLTGNWTSGFIWRGSIYIKSVWGVNFGIKKEFMDGKLQLRLTGTDIFNTNSDYRYNGNYGGIDIVGVRYFDNSRFGGGLTFKFGNDKLKEQRKKRSGLGDELNRISQ